MKKKTFQWTQELLTVRRTRAGVVAFLLGGFVALVYFMTMARLSENIQLVS